MYKERKKDRRHGLDEGTKQKEEKRKEEPVSP
jgi:hypothetical protein